VLQANGAAERLCTVETMDTDIQKRRSLHRHRPVTMHVLETRSGVPYELERRVCSECSRVLDERLLKRAAA
jgi:hypothetical protein